MNSDIGNKLHISVFGGSHEEKLGVVITGLPADFQPDMDALQAFMDRRAPGSNPFSTSRREPDHVIVEQDHPLTLIIRNQNTKPGDYAGLRSVPRPGHADFTARIKYGDTLNMSGGGPFSGRMTAAICMAGGLAIQVLSEKGIRIGAHILSIKNVLDDSIPDIGISEGLLNQLSESPFPVLSQAAGEEMKQQILAAKEEGDSVGGIVEAFATGLPVGLGGPLFDGVESRLAPLAFGIPGVKGLEFGNGFDATRLKGSENNDAFVLEDGKVRTRTNRHGGILGGITTSMPLIMRVALKPTPSISKPQRSVNLDTMEEEVLEIKGRHDPSIVLRAVPVVEAVLALGLLDLLLEKESRIALG